MPAVCTWPGCEKPYCCDGLCNMHVLRKLRGAEMDGPPRAVRTKRRIPRPSYQAMHHRVIDDRGHARLFKCAQGCGRQAASWAYSYSGEMRFDPSGRAYS